MATTEKTEHASGEWAMLFESDGDGRPDSYWCIEQDPEGFLCITNSAMTRERITPWMYAGWTPEAIEEMRAGFRRDGVHDPIISRFMEQAGF